MDEENLLEPIPNESYLRKMYQMYVINDVLLAQNRSLQQEVNKLNDEIANFARMEKLHLLQYWVQIHSPIANNKSIKNYNKCNEIRYKEIFCIVIL